MASLRMRFDDPDDARPTIDQLVGRFGQWRSSDDVSDFELLLNWKVDYADGWLDVWSRRDVEEFVLEWCPRKVSAGADWVPSMIECVAQGFLFMGEQGLLAAQSESAPLLAATAMELSGQCADRMEDPSYFGMAKSLFAGMGVNLDGEFDPANLQSLMDQFNSLPFEQRKAITDPAIEARQESIVLGPVVMPPADRIRESAAAAPVLAGFLALSDFFEAGRPLTKKGNVKLADADALSQILGTESLEEKIGDHTFRRHTAERMPELDHWLWWAREVGALRTVKGRMVAVKAWRDRVLRDPESEARKAFDVLISFGVVSAYRTWMQPKYVLDDSAIGLLSSVMTADGPVEFQTLVDRVMDLYARHEPRRLSGHESDRRFIGRDVGLLLTLAERAGVVVQRDLSFEADLFRDQRVGGTVELTDFGVAVVVENLREQGVVVETVGSPDELSAHDVAEVANTRQLSLGAWGNLLDTWLGAQDDPAAAMLEVFSAMQPLDLLTALSEVLPEAYQAQAVAVMRQAVDRYGPHEAISVIGYSWLVQAHDAVFDLSDDDRQRYRLGLLGLFAAEDPQSLTQAWGAGVDEMARDVQDTSRLMPVNAVELLEAIGRDYPDKGVAKSARREALRVRSRLANRQR